MLYLHKQNYCNTRIGVKIFRVSLKHTVTYRMTYLLFHRGLFLAKL